MRYGVLTALLGATATPAAALVVAQGTIGVEAQRTGVASFFDFGVKPGPYAFHLRFSEPVERVDLNYSFTEYIYYYDVATGRYKAGEDFPTFFANTAYRKADIYGFLTVPDFRITVRGNIRYESTYRALNASATVQKGATVSPVSYVLSVTPTPEPGTWAVMILGVGMVGEAMRRTARVRSRGVRFGPASGRA